MCLRSFDFDTFGNNWKLSKRSEKQLKLKPRFSNWVIELAIDRQYQNYMSNGRIWSGSGRVKLNRTRNWMLFNRREITSIMMSDIKLIFFWSGRGQFGWWKRQLNQSILIGTAIKISTIGQLSDWQVASMAVPVFRSFCLFQLFICLASLSFHVLFFLNHIYIYICVCVCVCVCVCLYIYIYIFERFSVTGNKCLSDDNRRLNQVWELRRPVCVPCNITYQLQPNKQTPCNLLGICLPTTTRPMNGEKSKVRRRLVCFLIAHHLAPSVVPH